MKICLVMSKSISSICMKNTFTFYVKFAGAITHQSLSMMIIKKTHTQIEIDAVTLNLELERQLDYLKCRTVWIRGKVNDSSKRMSKLINELKDSNKNNGIELQFEKLIDCLQYEQEFLHYYANLDGASPNGDNKINFPTRFTKKIPNILDD